MKGLALGESHQVGHTGVMDADVVVIGAGALGLSTALHCALAGRSVVVAERGTAGSQASGRAAGLFKSVQADELRTRLARRSIARAASFGDWAGVPLEAAPALVAERVSFYRAAGEEFALWCPEDVYIAEPTALIEAYLAACRLRGVVVAEHEPVTGIPVTGGRVTGV